MFCWVSQESVQFLVILLVNRSTGSKEGCVPGTFHPGTGPCPAAACWPERSRGPPKNNPARVTNGTCVAPQQSKGNTANVDKNTQICLLHVTWALMVGGACSPLGAKSSYLNSGSSTKRSTMSGGAARTTAEDKHIKEAAVSGHMTTGRMTRWCDKTPEHDSRVGKRDVNTEISVKM